MPAANRAEIASVIVSLVALAVAGLSFRTSKASEDRLAKQEQMQVASKVYLGEAPRYAAQQHPVRGQAIWSVVMNTSGDPIDDVWVEGRGGRSVRIQGIQRCTMYAVPADFPAVAVDFKDGHGLWRRGFGAVPPTPNGRPMPEVDTDDSPWYMEIQNCG